MPLPHPLHLLTLALAQAEGDKPAPEGGRGSSDMLLLVAGVVALFYFVMILPEKKNRKKRTDMLNALKKGDRVMTNSGIYGSVVMAKGEVVTLQVADGVRMRFSRAAIQNVLTEDPEEIADAKDKEGAAGS
jgi:preprotein translocase subunit YajC